MGRLQVDPSLCAPSVVGTLWHTGCQGRCSASPMPIVRLRADGLRRCCAADFSRVRKFDSAALRTLSGAQRSMQAPLHRSGLLSMPGKPDGRSRQAPCPQSHPTQCQQATANCNISGRRGHVPHVARAHPGPGVTCSLQTATSSLAPATSVHQPPPPRRAGTRYTAARCAAPSGAPFNEISRNTTQQPAARLHSFPVTARRSRRGE